MERAGDAVEKAGDTVKDAADSVTESLKLHKQLRSESGPFPRFLNCLLLVGREV